MINMKCPHCQTALSFQEELIGRSGPCSSCGGTVTVSAMVAVNPSPPIPYAPPAQAIVASPYAPLAQMQAASVVQQVQQEEIKLGVFFWIVVAIGAIFTFGLLVPFLWWYSRRYPKFIDPTGVTLRNGRRFNWSDLESVNRVSVTSSGIPTVNDALHLKFPGLLIGFNPALFVDGRRHHATIREYINRAFGA